MKKITLLAAAMLCGALTAAAQNTENGHEWVDLGLPSGLKWATCNVGATAPEEYGDYYAWGETAPQDNYYWDTYKFTTGGGITFTKYNGTDGKTTLEPEDDAAAVNWGGKWRMPTGAELTELLDNCTWTWVKGYNGTDKNGYEVKSNANGNTIFFPAAGYSVAEEGGLKEVNQIGCYWSSSLNTTESPVVGQHLFLYSVEVVVSTDVRFIGQSVRAVCQVTTPTALAAAEMPAVYAADGRIVCEQEYRVFDLLGRDVTRLNGHLNGVYVVKCGETAQKIAVR